ncbi:SdiA-regulated domain-containing protein [Paradesertivirga mongoliensis]|uniref:SdiA-regulated domain-containing protein n=1 Tax=Paradesertivirga mongoliensis TaxID=2100740 RepID=A0ABW4ZLP7_9SPHI|nr:SdiA-regulated domain-containing protein [Pedobacter mongoliensis]
MRTALLISAFIVLSIVIAFTIRTDVVEVPKLVANSKSDRHELKAGNEDVELNVLHKWDVPAQLKEISALTYLEKERFACIQDEAGKIFIYNTHENKIEKEIPFAGPGDYEGLAIAGKDAYILRADGRIFEIKNYNGSSPKTIEHRTTLNRKHDTEGLCFDSKNNRLLIAIKGSESESDDYKGIYSFSLNNKVFSDQPVYKIDLKNSVFEDIKAKKPTDVMQPAAIAVHPKTGDLYIMEGAKPKLLIMGSDGVIKNLKKLKDKEFAQPEGISFSPEGQLFISNEGGKKEPGNILEIVER